MWLRFRSENDRDLKLRSSTDDHFIGKVLLPIIHRFNLQSTEYPPVANSRLPNREFPGLPKTNANPRRVMPKHTAQTPMA
jgi:hypothetical protein